MRRGRHRAVWAVLASVVGAVLAGGCAVRGKWVRNVGGASAEAWQSLTEKAEGLDRVRVETPNGAVTVQSGEGAVVAVDARVTASGPYGSPELADWASRVKTETAHEGSTLVVRPAMPPGPPNNLGLSVSYTLRVPARLALDLNSDFGAVEASGAAGAVKARTANGSITLRDARGGVEARSDFGAVEATRIEGGARLETANGHVTAHDCNGDLWARSDFGAIEATHVSGSLDAKTANGQITARDVGGAVRASSDFGAVEVSGSGAADRDVDLRTANGQVSFQGGAARLTGKSDFGAVEADLNAAPRECSLTTSNGSITLTLPARPDADVTAQSANGSIDAAGLHDPQAVSTNEEHTEWRGRLGAGGHPVTLRTDFGSITVQQR